MNSISEIGARLAVQRVVTGELDMDGEFVTGRIALREASDGEILWSSPFEEPVSDLLDLQGQIVLGVAGSLRGRISRAEQQLLTRPAARNVEAHLLFQEGWMLHLDQESLLRKILGFLLTLVRLP